MGPRNVIVMETRFITTSLDNMVPFNTGSILSQGFFYPGCQCHNISYRNILDVADKVRDKIVMSQLTDFQNESCYWHLIGSNMT